MTAPDFPPLLQDATASKILQSYAAAGFEIRFVGGCVRDVFLKLPVKDIDFATTATPEQGMKLLQDNGIRIIPTGIEHGTLTAHLDGRNFEITTLRQDARTDGRHAVVTFTTDWALDAARRDFTVNALSVDGGGRLFDYQGGERDLRNKILRFIGDPRARMREDYLRILRYFRFASLWDWPLTDTETLAACREQAGFLKSLSRERVQHELYRLLSGAGALRVMQLLNQQGITEELFGFTCDLTLLETLIRHNDPDPFRRLWSLHDPLQTEWLGRVVVLSNAQKKRLIHYADLHKNIDWPLHKKLYYFGAEAVMDHACLLQRFADVPAIDAWQQPVFPLAASNLMQENNLSGKALGQTLRRLEEHWVNGGFQPTATELKSLI